MQSKGGFSDAAVPSTLTPTGKSVVSLLTMILCGRWRCVHHSLIIAGFSPGCGKEINWYGHKLSPNHVHPLPGVNPWIIAIPAAIVSLLGYSSGMWYRVDEGSSWYFWLRREANDGEVWWRLLKSGRVGQYCCSRSSCSCCIAIGRGKVSGNSCPLSYTILCNQLHCYLPLGILYPMWCLPSTL